MPLWYNMDLDKNLNSHIKKAPSPVTTNDNSSNISDNDSSSSKNESNVIKQDINVFNNIKEKWSKIESNTTTSQVQIPDKPSYSTKQDENNFKNVKNMWQSRIKTNIEDNMKIKAPRPVLKKKKSEYLTNYLNCTEDIKK